MAMAIASNPRERYYHRQMEIHMQVNTNILFSSRFRLLITHTNTSVVNVRFCMCYVQTSQVTSRPETSCDNNNVHILAATIAQPDQPYLQDLFAF
jgi:hypothetical protein